MLIYVEIVISRFTGFLKLAFELIPTHNLSSKKELTKHK